jgi:hypothetical protein
MEMALRLSSWSVWEMFGGGANRLRTDLRSVVALMLVACIVMLGATGCTTENSKQVVSQIAAQIPIAQSFVTAAAGAAAGIDPPAALLISTTAATVQTGLAELKVLCDAYAQSQSPTALASINEALNKVLNTNAAALLDAAHVFDPVSRGIALASLGALQTALQIVYAILQKIQTRAQVKATAALRTYRLCDVAPYLEAKQVREATGLSLDSALRYEEAQGF